MRGTLDTLYPGQDTLWSSDRAYRYFLRRPSLLDLPPIAFLLLNPSTADEVQDDPTIRRCRGYAADWGYGEVIILNAFALPRHRPQSHESEADPIGPENDRIIQETAQAVFLAGGTMVCGWGNHGAHKDRGATVRRLLAPYPCKAFPSQAQANLATRCI